VKITKSRKKENIEREIEGKTKKKKREYHEKQQGYMVNDQTAKQTVKPLKEGKQTKNKLIKKNFKNHQFRNSGISVLVVLLLFL
jgi:hypothetical protein